MPLDSESDDESVADRSTESKAARDVHPNVVDQPEGQPATIKPAASTPTVRKPAVRKPAARKPVAGSVGTAAVAKAAASKTSGAKTAAARTTVPKIVAPQTTEVTAAVTPPETAVAPATLAKPTARKPPARKQAVRKPAVRKPTVAAPTTVKPSSAFASSLANSATDETTRPYATRDALEGGLQAAARTAKIASQVPADAQTEVEQQTEAEPQTPPRTPSTAVPKVVQTTPAKAAPKAVPTTAATASVVPVSAAEPAPIVIEARGLIKRFGHKVAVSDLSLTVRAGSFYGIVGPNGAGKTTTLSMITGLLRPAAGTVTVHGIDVWKRPNEAKRVIGVLPDRLRLFDRLTGAQLLYYAGTLRGLDNDTVRARSADLAAAFGLDDALNRLVADYSAGMTKKIALACAMIHSPRVLVLDEPFESVDPVSAVNVTEILQKYVAAGGTVVLSSHGMDLIQRVCDHVAIIVQGRVLAAGTVDEVRGQNTLEDRFIELAGGRKVAEGMEWLHNFSD